MTKSREEPKAEELRDRRKRSDAARDARKVRDPKLKRRDAFKGRIDERNAIAQILVRKFGLTREEAWRRTHSARPLRDMLHQRGQPPLNQDLYEAVEFTREWFKGRFKGGLPVNQRDENGRRINFWLALTKQWNAEHSETPERRYLTLDGHPDWRALQSTYQITRRRLEREAMRLMKPLPARSRPRRSAGGRAVAAGIGRSSRMTESSTS